MKILIEEDDSFIQPDGVATMIVVAVTKSDGKVVRFPYSAERSMSALISDINAKISDAPVSFRTEEVVQNDNHKPLPKIARELTEGKIHKECLVKCIKLLPRDKDAPIDMEIGGIYRVLTLPGKQPYYEIIDDTDYHKADIPRRVAAYPEEIEFYEKRKAPIVKELGKFERFSICTVCNQQMVEYRNDNGEYKGECENCKLVGAK